jgi:uncharacterized protein with GYD domain
MATFVSTITFTQKGLEAITGTTKRAAAFRAEAEKIGVKITNIYWTLGPFDGLMVFEAPDDETATAAALQLASKGNVHTSTVRAFDAAQIEKVIAKMQK